MELSLQNVFDRAYAVLEPDDIQHLKGTYGSAQQGGYCAVGTLRQAMFGETLIPEGGYADPAMTGPEGLYTRAYALACQKIAKLSENEYLFSVPGWNDAPGRTKADVLALFRELAADAAAETEVAA